MRLPDMPGVDRSDLDQFASDLESAAGFPFELVKQQGRYVGICLRGVLDDDAADDVRGVLDNWTTHASFLRHNSVHAWLLTSAQLSAREDAEQDDNGHKAMRNALAMYRPTPPAHTAVTVRGGKKKQHGHGPMLNGLPGQMLSLLQELSPDEPMMRDEFLSVATSRMPPQKSSRGNDRRRDQVRRALATCISKHAMHEHPGDRIGLVAP